MFKKHYLAVALALATSAHAADTTEQQRLQQLEAQLKQLQQTYQAQLQAMQQQIETLKKQAAAQSKAAVAAAPVTPAPAGDTTRANGFNPAISAVLTGTYANLSKDPEDYRLAGFVLGDEEVGPGSRGFSLGESELTLSATVDNWFYGQLTAALTPENEVELEEAYIQTLALPAGLTGKFGRFKSGIGYLNSQHSHVWDFVDEPLVYRAFFAGQYADDGVQLTWLAPTDTYLLIGGEVFRGDSYPVAGAAHDGQGTYTLFAKLGGDVGLSSSWQLGLGHLHGDAKERETDDLIFTGENSVNVVDFVWKWAPNGNTTVRNLKLQAEYFWDNEKGTYDGLGKVDLHRKGWYAQAVYQFMPRWRVGARYDELTPDKVPTALQGTALDAEGKTPRRSSVMLDYSNSEFSRVRLQFNRDESSGKADDQVYLQYTMSLGAHGAHSY
ncbi:Phosphate-selective porin O and P [Sulfurivirga caldicuralii]|uniref:Phosphate-selective porin O and P n=1 Tax=Sulfurivirga caldicuralii TaxID=364032 RepID=A0A1N6GTH3_9GAMM|nr:porin [Sulfurivirga caldicuralii]SIO10782.1 Phosphate-selective porin O and P [Sulfurivirga caldicuralii]